MIKEILKEKIEDAIKTSYPNAEKINFSVEDANPKFGDYSTNAAMILAKAVGESPQGIAQKLIENIKQKSEQDEVIETMEIAGPGFINFKIQIPYLNQKISEVISRGDKYGSSDIGQNKKIDVEFISANPTGPLTVGNSRGGVIGDVLSNVLTKDGWQVTREYYFNDAGGQIDVLGHSVLKDEEAQYKGDYIDELNKELQGQDYKETGKKAAAIMIEKIKVVTEKMGINFDVWFAEGKDLRDKGKVTEILAWLKEKNLSYEKDGAVWFKSTEFGDDKDRVIVRSNGEPTYFCLDCAYHKNKFEGRKFDRAINIWGADHHGDLSRVKGFVKALSYEDKFEIIVHQFVRITKDGKEVRMSKRTGNYITVEELIDEVGKDVYRFFMLNYAPTTHMDFDLDLAKEHSQKNPVFYVQYAYARINSILSKAGAEISESDIAILKEPEELALIKELIKFPELVSDIANDYQTQKLTSYAYLLAESFHHFYEKCPVIKADDPKTTAARIQLLNATKIVLKNTLDLIGISAPKKM